VDFPQNLPQHSLMNRNRTLEQYFFLSFILIFFFWMSLGILKPIILGLFLALVIYPLQRRLLKKAGSVLDPGKPPKKIHFFKSPASLAALLVMLFVGLIMVPLTYIGIVVAGDAADFTEYLKSFANPEIGADQHTMNLLGLMEMAHSYVNRFVPIPFENFKIALQKVGAEVGTFFGGWLTSVATSLPRIILDTVFFILALYFGLADGPRWTQLIKGILPFSRSDVDVFASTTENISRGVVIGSLISGLTQGIIIGAAYGILGVPRPLFFTVMTVIFSFIPFLGSLPAGLGGAIYLFANGQTGAGIAMLVAFFIASISDNIVKPWALKGETEIHPLMAFVSVVGGLSFFGFTGLFLGPVIAALTVVVCEILSIRSFDRKEQTSV
jgi:predicted PurR-regulated permease PerM